MYFPPIPVYPTGYDSDFTLFLVYNTSETITVADTDAYSEEIPIQPQHGNKPEIWPNNGYATIAGELFYYDAVDKNSHDRVCRLRRCVRNLGGRQTQFNSINTWVRGFVVAEHHNQIVDCILLIENFVGENFSEEPATLDWRIRHLADTPIISDDFGCPDVEFDFNVVSTSPATGTITRYNIQTQGAVANFSLQFGDGNSTTSSLSGTHTYAPGAKIDPVVVMTNDTCQMVQTANKRDDTNTPTVSPTTPPPFVVPVPIPPPIPPFDVPNINAPSPQMNMPPIMFPANAFPSIIEISQINSGPSVITVSPLINVNPNIIVTTNDVGVINGLNAISNSGNNHFDNNYFSNTLADVSSSPGSIVVSPRINVNPNIIVSTIVSDGNGGGLSRIPDFIPIGPFPPIPPIQIIPPVIPPIQIMPLMVPSVLFPSTLFNSPIEITVCKAGTGLSLIDGTTNLQLEPVQTQPLHKVEIDSESIVRIVKELGRTFAEVLNSKFQPQVSSIQPLRVELPDEDAMVTSLNISEEIPQFNVEPEVRTLDAIPTIDMHHSRMGIDYDVSPKPVKINMKARNLAQEVEGQCFALIPCTPKK